MSRINIPVELLDVKSYGLWENDWFLLCAGDYSAQAYNAMTVSWGSLGSLWNLPIAQVFVRPQRYTFEFIDRYDTFTLNAFPEHLRRALSVMGSRSGREGDKISQAGLTPMAASSVAAPTFAEARLVIECRKLYWQDMDPSHFLNPAIEQHYPTQDYHRIFIGEILAVQAATGEQ